MTTIATINHDHFTPEQRQQVESAKAKLADACAEHLALLRSVADPTALTTNAPTSAPPLAELERAPHEQVIDLYEWEFERVCGVIAHMRERIARDATKAEERAVREAKVDSMSIADIVAKGREQAGKARA